MGSRVVEAIHHELVLSVENDVVEQLHDEEVVDDAHDGEKPLERKVRKPKNIEEEIGVVSLSFHMDMLSVLLEELKLHRPRPPPMIPLCRIFPNEAIRTVGRHEAIDADS
ncbi:hypothetical protein O6H91_Y217600 [Diphasiastrum complanatum]|nr:hypothetical protein O6H91_Y217600 [Diphasiastrum complanatum]